MKRNAFFNYMQYEKRASIHTLTAYRKDLEQFFDYLKLHYPDTEVTDIDHLQIRSWIVQMLGNGITPRSTNRKLSALKSYFKYLRKNSHMEHDPMLKVTAPKVGKRLPAVVEQQQLEQLFTHVQFGEDFNGQRDRLILDLLYSTGMRRSELVNLTIGNIDLPRQQLKVLGKGNKERLIPFGQSLQQAIIDYLKLREQTFPDADSRRLLLNKKGENVTPQLVYNIVKKYLSAVTTAEKRSPHVLRHSFATHLANNGADINAIKELLGHANLAATQIYTHNSIDQLKKVYEQAHPKAKKNSD
ncbi:MAG: tyrosine-type recombinase/integrase [Saprospiraceae bacterium]